MESRLDRVTDWDEQARQSSYCARRLAALLQVSERQLRRFFSERHACSPHDFLNRLRLQVAHDSLAAGASVKCASSLVGFKQVSHFSRAFKKQFGFCPSNFPTRSADPIQKSACMAAFDNKWPLSITDMSSTPPGGGQTNLINNRA